jgi:hypothetical protein
VIFSTSSYTPIALLPEVEIAHCVGLREVKNQEAPSPRNITVIASFMTFKLSLSCNLGKN